MAYIDTIYLSCLLALYAGGGVSSYYPRMLLKVMLYGYCVKIFTGRRLAKALRQDVLFMWLSGMSRPDFRMLNYFKSGKANDRKVFLEISATMK